MKKIPTIFDRDWNGNKAVIDLLVQPFNFHDAIATEKVDGMNVRVTIRNGTSVRLEKRRNPNRIQKANGIVEPWYMDADVYSSEDKYLFEALEGTDLSSLPDGEWSAEALGPKIQGNPLGLDSHKLIFFSLGQAPVIENVPTSFHELKEWLPKQKSAIGDAPIEGIVWHWPNGNMAKIKTVDFSPTRK